MRLLQGVHYIAFLFDKVLVKFVTLYAGRLFRTYGVRFPTNVAKSFLFDIFGVIILFPGLETSPTIDEIMI